MSVFDGSHFESRTYWELSPYGSRVKWLLLRQERYWNKIMPLMEGPSGILTLYALVHWVIVIKYVISRYFWRPFWILHQIYYQFAINVYLIYFSTRKIYD